MMEYLLIQSISKESKEKQLGFNRKNKDIFYQHLEGGVRGKGDLFQFDLPLTCFLVIS